MKLFISIIAGILAFWFGFWVDAQLIGWVLAQFPPSAAEWLGIIKVLLWLFTFSATFAISAYLGILIGGIVAIIID